MGCQCIKSTKVQEVGVVEPGAGSSTSTSAPKAKSQKVAPEVIKGKLAQAKKTGVVALRECGLKALPDGAVGDGVASFRTVDLTGNALKSLPDKVGAWKGLQNLLCAENSLALLPEGLGQLASLQKLVLSNNQLRALGSGLAQLGSLATLQLDGNRLGPQLPQDVFSGPLAQALKELDLSGNALKELPASLAELGQLTRLLLARNELQELPESLGGLAKLQHLDAAQNRLRAVPSAVLQSASLSELWLKGNPMERLQLQETPGFDAFLQRRKQRIDAKIDSHVVGAVDLAVCGLD